jgi:hypothetical protein
MNKLTTRRLSDIERQQVVDNLELLESLSDSVGGWGSKSTQCRQKSFTTTITFDRIVDVFECQKFAAMMEKAPSLFAPVLRRLLELDDEVKRSDD